MKTLESTLTSPSAFDSLKNYVGESSFPGWDVLLCQNRDSDALTRSNFRSALAELGGESESVQIHRFGHWACGWWEALAVAQGTPAHVIASEIEQKLGDYPVVDEEDFSYLESEEAEEIWKSCYSVRDRIEYIRAHRSQFEFQDLADMLGCVRGNYFAGYASELIS